MAHAATFPSAPAPAPATAHAPHHRGSHRERRILRSERILATRAVAESLVSAAGLQRRPVLNQAGAEIGHLVDVVARWSDGQTYPPVTGLVVRVGRRLAFVDAASVDRLEWGEVRLASSRLDLRDFERRPGEVMLCRDVLDHQLVDTDGVQVIRAADLYLAQVLGRIRLVGVDVSLHSLWRRLGPARWRRRPTPERVIDWSAIQPFGESGRQPSEVRLRTSNDGLHRLRPGELADLLEDLERPARAELLDVLDPAEAADALEEMDPEEVRTLLREVDPGRAAALVEQMEPDEAVDALRDLDRDDRDDLLTRMTSAAAERLSVLLDYPEDRAGGIMTTLLVVATTDDTVDDVRRRLGELAEHRHDVDAVAVVDANGRLVWDLPLFDVALAAGSARLGQLVEHEETVTVPPGAGLADVAARFVEARRLSLLVVDDGRPVGRILADDVVDALLPVRGRARFPRLLQ